jgi:hypothetical protein
MKKRADQAAKRIFDNLTDLIRIEHNTELQHSPPRSSDSGIESDLDSWRNKAENAVNFKFFVYFSLSF